MKKWILLILSLIMILSFTACSNTEEASESDEAVTEETTQEEKTEEVQPTEEPKQEKIVVAIPQDPDFLDPHKAAASGTEEVMFNVFEGLVKSDIEAKLIPAAAESYTVSEDGLEYTFVLRKNVKFHNGKDMTMEDVEYSYKRLRGDITGEPLSSGFEGVEIEVIDDSQIKFILPEVNASFLVNLTEAIIPSDMEEDAHNQTPVGIGPYKFVEYEPSQKIVLEKFDDYYQEGYASIKEVEFRIFADPQTALMSLQAGEVDMYPRIDTENLDMLPDDYYYVEGPQNMVQIMAMNNNVEPLNDVKVRQAINYAVDVDEIIDAVASGKGIKLGSNMSPAMKTYFQEGLADTYNINIEKAKELMKEAGYENGFDTSITVPSNYQFHVDTAQVIAQQLSQIGINAEIKQVEWSVWLEDVYKGRNYDMTVIALTGKLDPDPVLGRYASDYARNFFNFNNADYDQLIKDALVTTDEAQRADLYKQAQTILTNEVPCVYIMDPNFVVALKSNIENYQLYPIYVQDISALSVK